MSDSEESGIRPQGSSASEHCPAGTCTSGDETCIGKCATRKKRVEDYSYRHRKRRKDERLALLNERDALDRNNCSLLGQLREIRLLNERLTGHFSLKCPRCGISAECRQELNSSKMKAFEDWSTGEPASAVFDQRLGDLQKLLYATAGSPLTTRRPTKRAPCSNCSDASCDRCQALERRRQETARSRAKKDQTFRQFREGLQWAVGELSKQAGQIKTLRSQVEELNHQLYSSCSSCGWNRAPSVANPTAPPHSVLHPKQSASLQKGSLGDVSPVDTEQSTCTHHNKRFSNEDELSEATHVIRRRGYGHYAHETDDPPVSGHIMPGANVVPLHSGEDSGMFGRHTREMSVHEERSSSAVQTNSCQLQTQTADDTATAQWRRSSESAIRDSIRNDTRDYILDEIHGFIRDNTQDSTRSAHLDEDMSVRPEPAPDVKRDQLVRSGKDGTSEESAIRNATLERSFPHGSPENTDASRSNRVPASAVWKHFTKTFAEDDRTTKVAVCTLCKRQLTGHSASNAKRHLETVHQMSVDVQRRSHAKSSTRRRQRLCSVERADASSRTGFDSYDAGHHTTQAADTRKPALTLGHARTGHSQASAQSSSPQSSSDLCQPNTAVGFVSGNFPPHDDSMGAPGLSMRSPGRSILRSDEQALQ